MNVIKRRTYLLTICIYFIFPPLVMYGEIVVYNQKTLKSVVYTSASEFMGDSKTINDPQEDKRNNYKHYNKQTKSYQKKQLQRKTIYEMLIICISFLSILLYMYYFWHKKRKEQILDKEEATHGFVVLNNITVPILLIDIENNNKIIFWNKAAEKKYGMELISHPTPHLLGNQESYDKFNIIYQDVSSLYDERIIQKEHKITYVKTQKEAITNEGKKFMVIVRIDITQLVEAKTKAQQNNKLQIEFIRNISHEIRTPLNAIVGFSNMLAETGSVKERKEYIRIINENSSKLNQLVNDILTLAKLESRTTTFLRKETDLNATLYKIVKKFHHLIGKKKIRIIPILTAESCNMLLDIDFIKTLFSNLISNAIKHSNNGEIKIGYLIKGEQIYFFVQDSGKGIVRERWESIFDKFEKIDSFSQGTGLGLSICKQIFMYETGSIGVYSLLNKGSLFWFSMIRTDRNIQCSGIHKDISKIADEILERRKKGLWFDAKGGTIMVRKGYLQNQNKET
ncbi:MAG: PAS domain-containing sensor histidine kinase [Bacteroidaceae bacterium]|nr:PAS domain-containing sensor histidine kinase [Bacteroidaceae bacterium]